MYPNKQQEELINKTFGCCRFIYNRYLAKRIELYENNKEEVKVYNAYEEAKKEYEVVRTGPHAYQIRGEKIERTYSLINLSTDEGISKLLSILRNLGVDDTLKEMGLEDGDIVTLCDFEFEYFK